MTDEVITYDEKSALLVVDVQNDFADPKGSLYVAGGEDVVDVANREIKRAVQAGAPVVYTRDWHPEATPHFEPFGGLWPVHCVRNSWGAEAPANLAVLGQVVRKGTGGEDGYSGFTVQDPESGEKKPTGLEELLRRRRIQKVVVIGLATDYCVKETALDALRLGFDAVILRDGVRAVNLQPDDGSRALADIVRAGGRVA